MDPRGQIRHKTASQRDPACRAEPRAEKSLSQSHHSFQRRESRSRQDIYSSGCFPGCSKFDHLKVKSLLKSHSFEVRRTAIFERTSSRSLATSIVSACFLAS